MSNNRGSEAKDSERPSGWDWYSLILGLAAVVLAVALPVLLYALYHADSLLQVEKIVGGGGILLTAISVLGSLVSHVYKHRRELAERK